MPPHRPSAWTPRRLARAVRRRVAPPPPPPPPPPPVIASTPRPKNRDERLLLESGLFDTQWYSMEADVSFEDELSAIRHYRTTGLRRFLSPHPLFIAHTNRIRDGLSPFGDYLTTIDHHERRENELFDRDTYLWRHPEAAEHPYGVFGHAAENLGPSTVFDLVALTGDNAVPWSELEPLWTRAVNEFNRTNRLALPGLTTTLDDDHHTRDLPEVDQNDSTLVSIVMPSFNRAASLRRALASVQAQTWTHWEAIVVDDGSHDDTVLVVETIAARDPRIRVVARAHEGVCAARNAGLEAARGGYIAFLDSDNQWQPDFLDTMIRSMHPPSIQAAYGTLAVETPQGLRYRANRVDRDILLVANHVDLNVLVLTTDLARRTGGFDTSLRRAVDYDIVLRVSELTELVHVPVIGVDYDDAQESQDRISVRESATWNDVVKLKHWIDWADVAARARTPDMVSVVITIHRAPLVLADTLRSISRAFADRQWEAVVVDATPNRAAAAQLVAISRADARVKSMRIAKRVSFSLMADLGCARTSGDTLIVIDDQVVPTEDALRKLAEAAAPGDIPTVAQPATVDRERTIVTAGSVFGPRHDLPAAWLAGRLEGDLDVLGVDPVDLPALDGRVFAIAAADFIELHGLDPLFDGELEVADLGLRLRERQPSARTVLLPTARVAVHESTWSPRRSAEVRRAFADRHRASLTPSPNSWWAPWGETVCGWSRLVNATHALAPVTVVANTTSGAGRWVLLTGDSTRADWMEPWARSLRTVIEGRGLPVTIHPGNIARHSQNHLDHVVLGLHTSVQLASEDQASRVLWMHDRPWQAMSSMLERADLRFRSALTDDDVLDRQGHRLAFTDRLMSTTLPLGTALGDPDAATPASGRVLLVGDASRWPLYSPALTDTPVLAVGASWQSVLDSDDHLPWPQSAETWASLLATASHVVVVHDHGAEVERFVAPPLLDALVVRGHALTNLDVRGQVWAPGVSTFFTPRELRARIADPGPRLGPDERTRLWAACSPDAAFEAIDGALA